MNSLHIFLSDLAQEDANSVISQLEDTGNEIIPLLTELGLGDDNQTKEGPFDNYSES